jgi:glyoxalase family protein
VLFEIARDEDEEHLGETLALLPFLEPYRSRIEEGLRPIQPLQIPLLSRGRYS